jgi:hypothetical protein
VEKIPFPVSRDCIITLGTAMKRESLAKFDPSQEVFTSGSPTGSPSLFKEARQRKATSGPSSQQLFVDPGISLSKAIPFDLNPLCLDATAPHRNFPLEEEPTTPVVFLKREPTVQNRFVPLQKWEGIVLQVLDDSFVARLVDLTSGGMDEEAEFPMEEVSDADRSFIMPGAVFYWNIGYIDNISGQRTRASVIRFRRLPVWRPEELERAKLKARHLSDLLDWK